MKKLVLIFGIFLAVFTACQEQETANPEKELIADKSEAARNSLSIITGMKGFNGFGIGKPSLFTDGVGISASGRSGSRELTTARILGDSTDNGGGDDNPGDDDWDDWDWTSCADETFTENADGSYTWTLDYGDEGCEDYGYFMKGKMIETYTEAGNTFSSSVEYINFGDNYFLMNGTSSYSGTWEEAEGEGAINDTDTAFFDYSYSGSYTYAEDLTIQITDSLEDGTVVAETYAIEAEGSESYDENGFTTNEGFSKYTLSNGDFYNTVISTPLFYSFACEFDFTNDTYVFVHVSGVESTTWQEGSESGEFSVNYGDGTCDNIITITENGESYDVDLSEEWEDDWEEGDENGDNPPNG